MDIIQSIIAVRKAQDGQRPRVTVDEDDITKITWHDDNPTSITNEQILAKQAELQADYDAKQYQRDRIKKPEAGGYPSIGDQMDMMWHDKKDGTTTWEDAVQAIKDANPKP
mgnify:CR=1 FL=1|jgi:hypothetical protein|tara:strand:- start:70 stop:402 length:333 start_codon:yes stop_codon:yes gene_type:complete